MIGPIYKAILARKLQEENDLRYVIEQDKGDGWRAPEGYTLSRQTKSKAVEVAKIMRGQDRSHGRPLNTRYRVIDNITREEVWRSEHDAAGKAI